MTQDRTVIHVGGVEFRLFHDKGETDDHTWVYIPRHNGSIPGSTVRRAAEPASGAANHARAAPAAPPRSHAYGTVAWATNSHLPG